ncbi:MAG TPA: GNAT family N-acetyltransferase [Phycisphaerae bacterium]|nr:GNAT family N-acetyltransferase [Phycisphaerae bacterium]
MRFVQITKDNFADAIQLRPKRTQYKYVRREAVLYSLGRAYVASRPDEHMPYLIEKNGKFVGSIRLRNYGHGVGFAAFFIDRNHQGKGLGREALLYLIDWVKEHYPKAGEIECAVSPENTVACRMYEGLGFRYTGVKSASGIVDMELQFECQQPAGGDA